MDLNEVFIGKYMTNAVDPCCGATAVDDELKVLATEDGDFILTEDDQFIIVEE